MLRAVILGAVLVHPLLFLAYFVFGATFGAVDVWNGNRAPVFGLDGGLMAIDNLATSYLITCGIVALVMSTVGAGLGVGAHLFRANKTTFLKVIGWALSGACIAAVGTAGVFLCMNPATPHDTDEVKAWAEFGLMMAGVNGAVVGFVLGAVCGIVRAGRLARCATDHKA